MDVVVRVLLHPDRLCGGDLVPADVTSTEPIFTGPEYDSYGMKRPVEYFNEQFHDAIKENIVDQSNLYEQAAWFGRLHIREVCGSNDSDSYVLI